MKLSLMPPDQAHKLAELLLNVKAGQLFKLI